MSPAVYAAARDLLFRLNAESAHHVTLTGLRLANSLHLLHGFDQAVPGETPVECMGLTFPNRVGLAAGLDKQGSCIDAFGRLGFGAVEIGTITPRPQAGNPKPRLFRLVEHEAIINRMGFNNPGITQGVRNVSRSKDFAGIVGFNIGKNKDTPNEDATADYLACLRDAYPVADYIAVNLSSPNTPGLRDLQAADTTARLIEALKGEQARLEKIHGRRVPLALKVAPDLDGDHIRALARTFLDTGLDGLIATNTTLDRAAVAGHPRSEEAGGLSGAPLTRRADEVVAAFHAELGGKIPIIGVGGIMTAEDAARRIHAGATLIQLYTGFVYHGPPLVTAIRQRLAAGVA
jgi:dihydroorotate dehydrogenase